MKIRYKKPGWTHIYSSVRRAGRVMTGQPHCARTTRQTQHLLRQLDQARHQALLARKKTALRRFAPLAAAAAIALVAVLVVKPLQSPDTGDTRLAGTTPDAVPEIYEDLDFYLWLTDHKASPDSST